MSSAAGQDPLAPIVSASTTEIIAERLREAIATGVFRPGDQLTEASLAQGFGVSRGPLREAMQRLTQEGLLVGHRNRGLFVMGLDDAEVQDIYLAREAIEKTAIEQIVARGAAAEATSLLPFVERMTTADVESVSAADIDFHVALVQLSRSPRLVSMQATLITQIRMCLTRMQGSFQPSESRVEEHRDIVEAILSEDVPRAHQRLAGHMRDGLHRLLSTPP